MSIFPINWSKTLRVTCPSLGLWQGSRGWGAPLGGARITCPIPLTREKQVQFPRETEVLPMDPHIGLKMLENLASRDQVHPILM